MQWRLRGAVGESPFFCFHCFCSLTGHNSILVKRWPLQPSQGPKAPSPCDTNSRSWLFRLQGESKVCSCCWAIDLWRWLWALWGHTSGDLPLMSKGHFWLKKKKILQYNHKEIRYHVLRYIQSFLIPMSFIYYFFIDTNNGNSPSLEMMSPVETIVLRVRCRQDPRKSSSVFWLQGHSGVLVEPEMWLSSGRSRVVRHSSTQIFIHTSGN